MSNGVRKTTSAATVIAETGVAQTEVSNALIIEDFEDGTLDRWVGQGSEVSITTTSLEGTYSMEHGGGSFTKMQSGSSNGAVNLPAKGAKVSWIVDTDDLGTSFWLVAFGDEDGSAGTSSNNIHIRVKGDGAFVLKEEIAGSEQSVSADGSNPIAANTTYEFTLQFHDGTDGTDNTATATCYNYDASTLTRGSEVSSINGAVDSSHATNNQGMLEFWAGGDGNQDERVDYIRNMNGITF